MKPFGLFLAVSTLVLGTLDLLDRRALTERVAATLEESEQTEALALVTAEPDRVRLRALASRSLLQGALEPFPPAVSEELVQAMLAGRVEQLEASKRLAEEAAKARPDDWQAQMLVGATTYLERSLRQDRTLFTESKAWEGPLLRAIDLAPSKAEPRRFLTMAYLEIWRMLSEQKRELTRQMLREAFEDRNTYERYIGPWLQVNSDLDEAFDVLPLRSFVWRDLRARLRSAKDWRRYLTALDRLEEAQRLEIESWREEAEQRLSLGDLKRGRTLLIEVLGALPVDGRWADLFDRTLTELPPGPIHRVPAQNVTAWLEWALDLCTFGDCPLSEESLRRAAGLAHDLPASRRAAALAASGDLPRALALFEDAADPTTNEWSAYHLLSARHLVGRGETSAAREALALVNPLPSLQLGLAATRRRLGEAQSFENSTWQQPAEHRYALPLSLEDEAQTIDLRMTSLPPRGCPIEVIVDGTRVARRFTHPSRSRLRIDLETALGPGEHRLEVDSPAGCYVTPGAAVLR